LIKLPHILIYIYLWLYLLLVANALTLSTTHYLYTSLISSYVSSSKHFNRAHIFFAALFRTSVTESLHNFIEIGTIILNTVSAENIFVRFSICKAMSFLTLHFFKSFYKIRNESNKFSLTAPSKTEINFHKFWIAPHFTSWLLSLSILSNITIKSFSAYYGPINLAISQRPHANDLLTYGSLCLYNY